MPQTLYGAQGGSHTTSDLYTFDPATGVGTPVGPIGFALTGLAFDPTTGILYGATSNNSAANPRSLVTIDPATGAGTLVGAFVLSGVGDIAFDAVGNLYGQSLNPSRGLCSIDKATGEATSLGSASSFSAGLGLTFDADATLWVFSSDIGQYASEDPSTGAETLFGPLAGFSSGFGARIKAATLNPGDGLIYGIDSPGSGSTHIVTIDTAGGIVADVATSSVGDLDALAWTLPTPPPPPPTSLLGDEPAASRLIVTDLNTATLTILDRRATGRQFLFTLDGPAYTTGQVASDDPEINIPYPNPTDPAFLSNNIRLMYWLRRETGATPPYVCRFGGIVMNLEDVAGDTPVSRYTAYDPWQYLMSRPIRNLDTGALPGPGGLVFPTGTRASDVAVGLLGQTELFDGPTFIDTSDGSLIEPTDPIAGAFTIDAGLSVGEAWQQLVQTGTIDIVLIPVYDPLGLPGKVVKLRIAKFAGTVKHEAVMAWDLPSRSVTGISRMVDGTRLANQLQYYAGQGGTPVALQTDATSLAAYGAYWAQQFFPGTSNTALVELLALAELLIRRNGQRSLSFDPAPERSPLALRDYGLGDYLPVWASRNLREPIGIDYSNPDPSGAGYQRVYAIPIELTDDGVEHPRGLLTSRDATGAAA